MDFPSLFVRLRLSTGHFELYPLCDGIHIHQYYPSSSAEKFKRSRIEFRRLRLLLKPENHYVKPQRIFAKFLVQKTSQQSTVQCSPLRFIRRTSQGNDSLPFQIQFVWRWISAPPRPRMAGLTNTITWWWISGTRGMSSSDTKEKLICWLSRSDDYPMMSSIWPTVTVCLLYVFICKIGGPW